MHSTLHAAKESPNHQDNPLTPYEGIYLSTSTLVEETTQNTPEQS